MLDCQTECLHKTGWGCAKALGKREHDALAGAIIQSDRQAAPLRFIFSAGSRPSRKDVVNWLSEEDTLSVSFNPDSFGDSDASDANWVELLKSGMVFDLLGLDDGPPIAAENCSNRVGLSSDLMEDVGEAVALQAGEHIASGVNTLPVLREYLAVAAHFIRRFTQIAQVHWLPSDAAIGPDFFAKSVESWVGGGPFPAIGLIAFKRMATNSIQTGGLSWIIGQELMLEGELADDPAYATRLGIRLINQLVHGGQLTEPERILAPDGTQLHIAPSENQKFIRVWVA